MRQIVKMGAAVSFIGVITEVFCVLLILSISVSAQDYENIEKALIYDYDQATRLGDKVYGSVICDFEHDNPGRNSHGGPVAIEYANGNLVTFHTNTDGNSLNGWSEYAISEDGGRTWGKYNKFGYSYDSFRQNPSRPVWVEEGLVTSKGTVILFVTHLTTKDNSRTNSGFMRSFDHGTTWSDYQPMDGSFVGYPAAVAVDGETNYVLFDSNNGPHVLYVSTDDGCSWSKLSTLSLENSAWYGAMCLMDDGGLLAGAYVTEDENNFYYCMSRDKGLTWEQQKKAYVDKRVRDPEIACLDGRYYLHGRAGNLGQYCHQFVLYQSDDGENWGKGIIVSSEPNGPDGYSSSCIINNYKKDTSKELMVLYSILYEPCKNKNTNEYVFFIKP